MSSTLQFTCLACRVEFTTADGQREHYRSDWHRYNLKRKAASLDPVTQDVFNERVKTQKSQGEAEAQAEAYCSYCESCGGKKFSSENTYKNHINSKKHKEQQRKYEATGGTTAKELSKSLASVNVTSSLERPKELRLEDVEQDGMDLEDAYIAKAVHLAAEDCIFCSYTGSSFEDVMEHMTMFHSFFIPDIEYVVDLKALVAYLGEKVALGNLCLFCNEKGKSFRSLTAVRKHMIDKCHIKLDHSGDAMPEFAEFYDFRASYPDASQVDDTNDEEVSQSPLFVHDITDELCLPNGSRIGHRNYAHFYRQKLKPEDQKAIVAVKSKLVSHYRAVGMYAPAIVAARKDQRIKWRQTQKHQLHIGVKANKLQHYYREQNPL